MGRGEEGFTTGEKGVMAVGRVEEGVMAVGRVEKVVMAIGRGEEGVMAMERREKGVTGCFSAVEVTNTRQMQGIFVAALVQGKVGLWQLWCRERWVCGSSGAGKGGFGAPDNSS